MSKKKEIRRFDLSKPFNPSDIKGLSEDELNLLAEDVRTNIINSCAKNGGHLSSSFKPLISLGLNGFDKSNLLISFFLLIRLLVFYTFIYF